MTSIAGGGAVLVSAFFLSRNRHAHRVPSGISSSLEAGVGATLLLGVEQEILRIVKQTNVEPTDREAHQRALELLVGESCGSLKYPKFWPPVLVCLTSIPSTWRPFLFCAYN